MSKPQIIYEFAGFIFNPAKRTLVCDGKEVALVERDSGILRLLIENRPDFLSKDKIMNHVWGDVTVNENSIEKAIVALRKMFGDNAYNPQFIKTATKKGYAFIHDVVEITENVTLPKVEKPVFQKSFSRHSAFILTSSLLYGLLFWIVLLLEIAYRFDRFGTAALWLGVPVVLWIAAAVFIGLTWTRNLVRREKRNAFFVGLAFFVGGTISLCLAMSYFLPNEAITLANFQTQPAFAAFVKNSLIYFLPLGVIFILIPFHFVCVRQIEMSENLSVSGRGAINLRPSLLFAVWLAAAVYSIVSTFRLLDNLLPEQFHNLFVTLIFLRFFVYFSLGLGCLLWYKSQRAIN